MLGPTKVFASPSAWKDNKKSDPWSLVMSRDILGTQPLNLVPLSIPVVVLAKQKRGFYIHCSVIHDEAIIYQSYNNYEEVTVQDKNIVLFPGQARCGFNPFDNNGRWRFIRGFSGRVIYRAIKKVWSPRYHMKFPTSFRTVVRTLLMLWDRPGCILNVLPKESIFDIIGFMDWDWFESEENLNTSEPTVVLRRTHEFSDYYYY